MNNIYLTFDVDWASDDVLAHTLDILEEAEVKATFFVTHDTKLLRRMRDNKNIELGLHPNYRPLFAGSKELQPAAIEVIKKLQALIPEAQSVRSHALATGTDLLRLHYSCGLTHDTNMLIPHRSQIKLKPYKYLDGITMVPFFWEDDIHCVDMAIDLEDNWDAGRFLTSEGLKVFNFHPIHIYLNTENLSRYEAARSFFHTPATLSTYAQDSSLPGSAFFLRQIIDAAKTGLFNFGLIRDITA